MDTPTRGMCYASLFHSQRIPQNTVLLGLSTKICFLEWRMHGRKYLKPWVFEGSMSKRPVVPSLPLGDSEGHGAALLGTCSQGLRSTLLYISCLPESQIKERCSEVQEWGACEQHGSKFSRGWPSALVSPARLAFHSSPLMRLISRATRSPCVWCTGHVECTAESNVPVFLEEFKRAKGEEKKNETIRSAGIPLSFCSSLQAVNMKPWQQDCQPFTFSTNATGIRWWHWFHHEKHGETKKEKTSQTLILFLREMVSYLQFWCNKQRKKKRFSK